MQPLWCSTMYRHECLVATAEASFAAESGLGRMLTTEAAWLGVVLTPTGFNKRPHFGTDTPAPPELTPSIQVTLCRWKVILEVYALAQVDLMGGSPEGTISADAGRTMPFGYATPGVRLRGGSGIPAARRALHAPAGVLDALAAVHAPYESGPAGDSALACRLQCGPLPGQPARSPSPARIPGVLRPLPYGWDASRLLSPCCTAPS